MAITNTIGAVLDTALEAATGLPAIAYENVKYTANAPDEHIEVQFFVTSRRPAVRGPNPQHRIKVYIAFWCASLRMSEPDRRSTMPTPYWLRSTALRTSLEAE